MRTLLFALPLVLPLAANADTLRSFDLSATFQSIGYAADTVDFGTLAIDTTT